MQKMQLQTTIADDVRPPSTMMIEQPVVDSEIKQTLSSPIITDSTTNIASQSSSTINKNDGLFTDDYITATDSIISDTDVQSIQQQTFSNISLENYNIQYYYNISEIENPFHVKM